MAGIGSREHAAVCLERDRIAAEMHHLVIRRLFAAGLGLEKLCSVGLPAAAAAGIRSTIDELDAAIRDIRSTIFLGPER